jgi:cysteine desulfurase/selenocysteine lyase
MTIIKLLMIQSTEITKVRVDFPILEREVRPGVKLVYLDSAATSQKPLAALEAMEGYYRRSNANIHRGVHTLAEEATAMYEGARERLAAFIGAGSPEEVIFTRNTTESINLVAYTWGRKFLQAGDVVLLTEMEHHSNIVPWHILAAEKGIQLKFIPITPDFLFDMDAYQDLLQLEPKLVAFTHMSNVLGPITPAQEIIRMAHEAGALALVDGASRCRTLPWMCAPWTPTLWPSRRIRCAGRRGSRLYGKKSCWQRCRLSWAAAI